MEKSIAIDAQSNSIALRLTGDVGFADVSQRVDVAAVVEVLAIEPRRGTLDAIKDFPSLRKLNLISHSPLDVSELNGLSRLRSLIVQTSGALDLNLACFPELVEFGCSWSDSIGGFAAAKNLKICRIGNYTKKDLGTFALSPGLKELQLTGGGIKSLNGIEKYRGLETLSLLRLTHLEDIGAIEALRSLRHLRFDTCKKIGRIDVLAKLSALETINLDNMGGIVSLTPLAALKKLHEVTFTETTNVIDGDIAVLLNAGIQKLSFMNRKHYNIRRDFSSSLQAK